jgi:hypothetical protein
MHQPCEGHHIPMSSFPFLPPPLPLCYSTSQCAPLPRGEQWALFCSPVVSSLPRKPFVPPTYPRLGNRRSPVFCRDRAVEVGMWHRAKPPMVPQWSSMPELRARSSSSHSQQPEGLGLTAHGNNRGSHTLPCRYGGGLWSSGESRSRRRRSRPRLPCDFARRSLSASHSLRSLSAVTRCVHIMAMDGESHRAHLASFL